MNCPNCKYTHGYEWIENENKKINGEKGKFFTLPIKVERTIDYVDEKRKTVYACPACGILFADI